MGRSQETQCDTASALNDTANLFDAAFNGKVCRRQAQAHEGWRETVLFKMVIPPATCPQQKTRKYRFVFWLKEKERVSARAVGNIKFKLKNIYFK